MTQQEDRRNSGHKGQQAQRFAVAVGDAAQLSAAFDWFRASAGLMARRRTPSGVDQAVHEEGSWRLIREMTAYLKLTAEAIDRGDYDARGD